LEADRRPTPVQLSECSSGALFGGERTGVGRHA
jgi:hypothetical protein